MSLCGHLRIWSICIDDRIFQNFPLKWGQVIRSFTRFSIRLFSDNRYAISLQFVRNIAMTEYLYLRTWFNNYSRSEVRKISNKQAIFGKNVGSDRLAYNVYKRSDILSSYGQYAARAEYHRAIFFSHIPFLLTVSSNYSGSRAHHILKTWGCFTTCRLYTYGMYHYAGGIMCVGEHRIKIFDLLTIELFGIDLQVLMVFFSFDDLNFVTITSFFIITRRKI